MSLFRELKRRNVFRVAAAYVVAAWLLIEVGNTLEETLRLPEWADTLLAFFLILGFPLALFFSWAYEITPEGVRRESELQPTDASRNMTARKLDWAIIVMFSLAAGYFAVEKLVFEGRAASNPVVSVEAPVDSAADSDTQKPYDLSIAVLPFVNMSPDPEQEYFSDGLTEELLNLLASIEQLKVAARTSSFFYKDKLGEIPLAEIAGQLGVAHVLEGSVRKGGDRIRITAQLIKADDGFHLWSKTWDRTLDDIFAIQDEIATAVVDELRITLLGEVPKATVLDPESYQLALEGRYLFGRRAKGDLERALELFRRAVELDPDNAIAWLGMTPLYLWLFDPPRVGDALTASQRAVTLEPDNAEAWSRRARALWMAGEEDDARDAWSRAMDLGEDSPLIQGQIAGQLGNSGYLEGAIAAQRRAMELDPLYLINLNNLASYLVQAGQLEESREYAEKLLDLAPNSAAGYEMLAQIHLLQGRPVKARELIDRRPPPPAGMDLSFQASSDAWWDALIEYALGNDASADAALEQVIAEEGERRPVSVASLYAWRGETDEAFDWLNRALDKDPDLSIQWSWEPWLDSLEDDPRWAELMERWTGTEYVGEA